MDDDAVNTIAERPDPDSIDAHIVTDHLDEGTVVNNNAALFIGRNKVGDHIGNTGMGRNSAQKHPVILIAQSRLTGDVGSDVIEVDLNVGRNPNSMNRYPAVAVARDDISIGKFSGTDVNTLRANDENAVPLVGHPSGAVCV